MTIESSPNASRVERLKLSIAGGAAGVASVVALSVASVSLPVVAEVEPPLEFGSIVTLESVVSAIGRRAASAVALARVSGLVVLDRRERAAGEGR
ncbi:MAG: hypothetical protein R3A79_14245 [Nannocystaceae bacterium]